MALNHTHQIYENYVLAQEIEDQLVSKLDLMRFCTIDNSLMGVAGDIKKIRVYNATDATEKLAMGEGNTKNIEVAFSEKEYKILLAQNRFPYYDEEVMRDPKVVEVGMKHMATDMVNTEQADVFAEFNKASQTVNATALDFNAFVDATAILNLESTEGVEIFAFVCPADLAEIRKNLKETLQYVEAYARTGYIGSVGGVNLYVSHRCEAGTICGGTREAVTLFNKKGTEVEQERDANVRLNEVYSRKYYLAALTDETKAFKIVKAAG